ncbi:nitroreductase family protein [Acinetobacter baumannii]|uniref:nitroreductase family protein n=1 Tax=Acinetobacter baumannii TaxID=470 RepID=UPI0009E112FC|nr:nitroreductase family protein [Acinetobacter baumannii]ARG21606.1 nitroreductase family protein [Acinetobacter baumannii]ARG22755.1 nitroreductase family protein [Acinetobacter baumannii]ARG27915.1 nitroreductase family protein [Acinetobacter baumannii]MUQ42497.1 nitroreductase family protein [Acinetobacter baumannii]MUR41533.1 nitroreductase family protein [Acinetobacter baumannii]
MNVIDALRKRRAVKRFDPAFQLSEDDKKQLLQEVLANAPSAFNLQHWRPVIVEDAELRQKIRAIAWDQPQVTESSLLIVLCAKVNTWEVDAKRVWDGASPEVQDIMVGAIDQYYRDRPQTQRDEVMRSAGIFAQTLVLLAQEHGLDSCPMDGFDFDAMAKLINLPEDHVVCLMIAVGKSASEPYPRVGKLPYDDVIIKNTF